jgi:hypothetical protein
VNLLASRSILMATRPSGDETVAGAAAAHAVVAAAAAIDVKSNFIMMYCG